MRTRTRNNISDYRVAKSVTGTKTVYRPNGSTSTSTASPDSLPYVVLKGTYERISDQTGIGSPHSCIHRRLEKEIVSTFNGWPDAAAPWGWYSWGGEMADREPIYYSNLAMSTAQNWDVSLNSGLPPGWTVSYGTAQDSVVINDLVERLDRTVADAPLNIIESAQFWPSLKSLAKSIPRMGARWPEIRRVLRHAPSSFLAWKFGIGPVISDLTNIAKFGPDMYRQYKQSLKQPIKRVSKLYIGNAAFAGLPVLNQSANGIQTILSSHQGMALTVPQTRYVLVAKRTTPKYQSEAFAKADFLMRRFTTSPASLAWELVPFSFVLDWFVDIRSALQGIDQSLGVKPWSVLSCTKSTEYLFQTDSFLRLRSSAPGGQTLFDSRVGTSVYRHYERSLLAQPGIMPGWKGRFGKNQAAILAALILQGLNKHKGANR